MAEAETALDTESANIQREAAATKADLTQGTDAAVPTGQEKAPQPRIDPSEARKTLFKRRNEEHQRDLAAGHAAHLEVLDIEKSVNQSMARTDGHDELARTAHINTEQQRKPAEQKKPEQPAKTPAVDAEPERVTITVNGKQRSVLKSEADEAGGVVAYQKQLAASIAFNEAHQERQRLAREREEFQKERQAAASAATAGGGTPPAQGASGDAGVQDEAEKITALLFGGNRTGVKDAVTAILTATRGQANLDPNKIAELAAERLRAETTKQAPAEDEYTASIRADRAAANEYMAKEHADILADPDLLKLTREKFTAAYADPNNAGRTHLAIAKEVAAEVARKFGAHPRGNVIERKRSTLPATPAGGGKAPDDQQPVTMSPQDYIARLRRASGKND